ncbi:MAG: PEP-CTERM sorting domain-containing protein [Gammaproteobacteria bacterium]
MKKSTASIVSVVLLTFSMSSLAIADQKPRPQPKPMKPGGGYSEVSEPGALALVGLGLLGTVVARRRKQSK